MGSKTNIFSDELLELLGEDDFIRLCEARGGTSLYVGDGGHLADELGDEIVAKLCDSYRRDYIKVPLAREMRARAYRMRGMSNAKIAARLGVTQRAVERIFARVREAEGHYEATANDNRGGRATGKTGE